jgi:prevent-host-death family protein
MRYITATEANQKMSSILRDVAAGASYTVTSRGKPVAKLVPVAEPEEQGKDLTDLVKFARSLPRIYTGPWKREDLYER